MEKIYKAAKGARFTDEEAQKIGPELEQIEERHGKLTPDVILAEARKKKSYLHRFFDWSDSLAAEKWRKHQARQLISHVRVVIVDDNGPRKAWENVRVKIMATESEEREEKKQEEERNYVSVEAIEKDEYLREQVVKRGIKELETWLEKYKHYEELKPLAKNIQIGIDQARRKFKMAA